MKPASLVTVIFLLAVALLHLFRLVLRVEVVVGGTTVPVWVSLLGLVGPGALAIWLWREGRASGTP